MEIPHATPAAQALGRTLIHSLWQSAAAAAALGVLRPARARYAAACSAMLAMLLAFALTFAISLPRPAAPVIAAELPGEFHGTAGPALSQWNAAGGWMPWLAPLWLMGFALLQARNLVCWTAARRLASRGVCAAADPWQRRLHSLKSTLRIARPVALLESSLAGVPAVIGWLRPVIVVPVGFLAGLPPKQVESILLHELAHIRRADYLVNLVQACVESVLFYHPATWWISRVIRIEREHCCDDLVVSASGDAHAYASALAALEQGRAIGRPALAASGGSLLRRIRRILQPEGPRAGDTPVWSAALLATFTVLSLYAWQERPKPLPSSPYEKWLNEDVFYLISDSERALFEILSTDGDRERFIEQFWQRRDPTPGTPVNEMKEEHYQRIAFSNEKFAETGRSGWQTDRGRFYIALGPPDQIESHPSGGAYTRPPEQGGGTVTTYPFGNGCTARTAWWSLSTATEPASTA